MQGISVPYSAVTGRLTSNFPSFSVPCLRPFYFGVRWQFNHIHILDYCLYSAIPPFWFDWKSEGISNRGGSALHRGPPTGHTLGQLLPGPTQSRGSQTKVGALTSCLWLPFRGSRVLREARKQGSKLGRKAEGWAMGRNRSIIPQTPFSYWTHSH